MIEGKGRLFFCLLGATLLGACAEAVPSENELETAIAAGFDHYSFVDSNCKTFPSKQIEGAGRASCSGQATLNSAFYEESKKADYSGDLAKIGIPTKASHLVWRRDINRQLIKTVTASGMNVGYSSECQYRELTEGWNIDCQTNIPRPQGRDRSSFPAQAIILGSDEYEEALKQIQRNQTEYDAELGDFKSKINAFFASGQTIEIFRYDYKSGDPEKILTMQLGSSLKWQETDDGWNGVDSYTNEKTAFWTQTKFQSVDGRNIRGSNQNFCGFRRGEPRDDIMFSGKITNGVMRQGIKTGRFGARIKIMDRSGNQNNAFRCGLDLYWTGEDWVVGWGVNRNKKYLAITSG